MWGCHFWNGEYMQTKNYSKELNYVDGIFIFKPGYRTGQHGVQNRQAVSVPGKPRFPRISIKYEMVEKGAALI